MDERGVAATKSLCKLPLAQVTRMERVAKTFMLLSIPYMFASAVPGLALQRAEFTSPRVAYEQACYFIKNNSLQGGMPLGAGSSKDLREVAEQAQNPKLPDKLQRSRQRRGLPKKEHQPTNPGLSVEGQKDLIDVMKPKAN